MSGNLSFKGQHLQVLTILCLSLFCAKFIQAQPSQKSRPNIIWITCEDISPYLGCYGDTLVKTPNLDAFARQGIRYTRAYTVAGVCAPSRSSLITGMYPTSIGTQHMRTAGDLKFQPVPLYSAVIPEEVKCFPELLRQAGYYCTNNEKQDYQFQPPVTVWDENGPAASYRNRPDSKPFFAVFNFFLTHESQLFNRKDPLLLDSQAIAVPPYYPDTRIVRHDMDRLFTNIENMDAQVGELIKMLKEDGVYENSIIFFFSDHGGALPWMKREILERGTHIPLLIHLPKGQSAGSVEGDLVSEVDFAPTVLSLAGVPIPSYMQGQAFLGNQKSAQPRKYVFAGRDRMDTEYDRVRMVRDRHFRYLFNYMPEKIYYQNIQYRLDIPMMREFLQLRDSGRLNPTQMAWFTTKPMEELYDVDKDPHELHNLATDPKYQSKLVELRTVFQNWTKSVGDRGAEEELAMIHKMWNGQSSPPTTEKPSIIKTRAGLRLSCATRGASLGYRILKSTQNDLQPEVHTVSTWDYSSTFNIVRNGQKRKADPVWEVYQGHPIQLAQGDTLLVNAMRIGYLPATEKYFEIKSAGN